MFQTKEKVFDRIEQSIKIFLKAPIQLSLPFVLLQASVVFLSGIVFSLIPLPSTLGYENLTLTASYILLITGSFAIVYLIAIMIVKLALILGIMQVIKGEGVTPRENIALIWKNIKNIFTLYWYVFQYVYLYPSVGIIMGGIIFLFGEFNKLSEISIIGGVMIGLSLIWMAYSAIIKGTRSIFALYHGVTQNDYTKHAFQTSLNITSGNWWRIVGNLFLVSLIIGLITGIFDGIIGAFKFASNDLGTILHSIDTQSSFSEGVIHGFESELQKIGDFNLWNTLLDVVSIAIGTTLGVIMSVFITVFYLRLFAEYSSKDKSDNADQINNIPEDKIEL